MPFGNSSGGPPLEHLKGFSVTEQQGMHRESISREAFMEFNDRGKVIYHDPKSNLTIRRGHLYFAQTLKGGKNLIVAAYARSVSPALPFTDGRAYSDWVFYGHGPHVRQVPLEIFARSVETGELEPADPTKIDPGRLDLSMIMLDAMINGRTPEATLTLQEDEATEFLQRGQFEANPFAEDYEGSMS